jgi:hypothetical protein
VVRNLQYYPQNNDMQRLNYAALALLMATLSSCEAIGGIFKAGVWSGIILVAVVIAIVIWIITRLMK